MPLARNSRSRNGRILGAVWVAVLSCPPIGLTAQTPISVRDSIGIRIVEADHQLWKADRAWQLSPEPIVRIGQLDGDEDYILYGASWSAFLSDGRIVILNAGAYQVRIYRADGTHVRTFGRAGDGPGEFKAPRAGVVLPGDTIVIQDNQDLEFFTVDGDFVRQTRIVGGRPFPWPHLIGQAEGVLIFRDGDWESRQFHYDEQGRAAGLPEVQEGVDRGRYAIVAYDTSGALIDTLSSSVGTGETWISRTSNSVRYTGIPFSPGQYWSIRDGSFVTGHSATPEVRFLRPTGTIAQIARLPLPEVESGPAAFWRYFERAYQDEPVEARRRARPAYEQMPKYEYLPLFGGLTLDDGGRVWLQSYSPADVDDDPRWFVVAPTGGFLGVVRPRPRIWVDEITDDAVLGRARDELDVEYVVVYRIIKPD